MVIKCDNCGAEMVLRTKFRSQNENRYFHGVVLPLLSDFTGHPSEDIKYALKQHFGWMKTKEMFGKIQEVPMSTSEMSTTEFEQFMTQIRMFGDTIGVYIPTPNEVTETK